MGQTVCRASVTLVKDVYTVGEKIKVMVDCNNSACSRDVSSFDVKLQRRILVEYDDCDEQTVDKDIISEENVEWPCRMK